MPEIATEASDNPEFARVVEVARLKGKAEFPFDLAPTEAEAAALARLLDARAVRKLRFRGRLAPSGEGWEMTGALGVTVVQTCVVTLEPVTTRLDLEIRRLFLPQAGNRGAEIAIAPLDDDETEPLEARIDLGRIAIEAIALALPPYPRAEGAPPVEASVAPPGVKPLGEAEIKPFASLAALKEKLGNRH